MSVTLSIAVGQAPAVRVELTRTLTTVGSAASADVRLAGVEAQWLVVQRAGTQVTISQQTPTPTPRKTPVAAGIILLALGAGATLIAFRKKT